MPTFRGEWPVAVVAVSLLCQQWAFASSVEQDLRSGNYRAAIPKLEAEVANGDRCASYNLGAAYVLGDLTPRGFLAGTNLLKSIATTPGPCRVPANYTLGLVLDQAGKLADAVPWYTEAANANYPDAQYNLGMLYLNGNGVRQNCSTAFDLINKAAIRGQAAAQFNLAWMYGTGKCVKPNIKDAHMWAVISAKSGNAKASGAVADGRRSLPQDMLLEAEAKAASFRPISDFVNR